MKVTEFEKLDKRLSDNSFESKYKVLDVILYISSFIGNIASIFFAFFFFSQLLYKATSDFTGRVALISIASVVSLSLFELLKRSIFNNVSTEFLMHKTSKEFIVNSVFSLILLSGSFYLSLSGAKIFADKSETIAIEYKAEINTAVDSIGAVYTAKLEAKEVERAELIESKRIYNEKIRDAEYTSRLKQYNALLRQSNEELKIVDSEMDRLREEMNSKISEVKETSKAESEKKISQVFDNQFAFIIISSFIELLILVGVWFHCLYRITAYKDFKKNMHQNTQYGLHQGRMRLLKIMYNMKVTRNIPVELGTRKHIIGVFSSKDIPTENASRFLDVCQAINITKMKGDGSGIVVIIMSLEDAKEAMVKFMED